MAVEQTDILAEHPPSLALPLYTHMLTTRLFEEACIRWEHEGAMSAQVFPSRGQEAIAVGGCLALEKGDTVIPSFRTRGAMMATKMPPTAPNGIPTSTRSMSKTLP